MIYPKNMAKVQKSWTVESLESRRLLASAAAAAISSDPLVSEEYALTQMAVDKAWAYTKGSAAVVVADIDTGADYTHEDLYKNIWINPAEIPTDYARKLKDVDGDGVISFYDLNSKRDRKYMTDVNANGYIDAGDLLTPWKVGGWEDGVNGVSSKHDVYTDDIIGWDFAENDNNPFDDGTANEGHGTHTAGTIAAVGDNGVGISGVIQKVSLIIVRIFADDGSSATNTQIANAIIYTADNGAKVANASWGGTGGQQGDAIYNAISYAGDLGEIIVVAAGNDSQNLDSSRVNDFPAEYNLSNIVVVGATTRTGTLASFSNYGSSAVDLLAPGVDILSTLPGNKYGKLSGTSMAAPQVTGSIALMIASKPTISVRAIETRLTTGSDETASLDALSVSDGAVNTNNAVFAASGADYTAPATGNTGSGDTSTDPTGGLVYIFLPPPFFFFSRNAISFAKLFQ